MSLLPKWFLDTVVSIEIDNGSQEFNSVASGFLMGLLTGQKNENNEDLFRLFLVTNKHVLIDREIVHLRFNKGEGACRYNLPLTENGKKLWLGHSIVDVDIAVIPIMANKLLEDKVEFQFIRPEQIATIQLIKSLGITQGDEVFVLGFPMGLAGKIKKYALVRNGMIARLDDDIIMEERAFLIDSTIFPGNSGGPVFLKPAMSSIEGTAPINRSYLIGVISRFISYQDTAFTLSTTPPQQRIVFTENSGLAYVVPMDFAIELATEYMKESNNMMKADELGTSVHNDYIQGRDR